MALSRRSQERTPRGVRYPGMATTNIHDRASIERVYPRDVYASDTSENERRQSAVLKGVRITEVADQAGDFAIERAARQAGEAPGPVFLAPFHRVTTRDDASVEPDLRQGYEAFLDEIVEAAQRPGFRRETSPGPGDVRLRGPRQ